MSTSKRITACVNLTLCRSRDTQQLDISWRCEVSARVTFAKATFNEPRDMQVDSFEVDGVTSSTISYTTRFIAGAIVSKDVWLHEFDSHEEHYVIEYLNANLDDRDDWQEEIIKAVLANVDQR